jgi:hypothetical protein
MQDFQPFINYHIYFNSFADEQEKSAVKELVLETCKRIERKNPGEILEILTAIEFIVHKPVPPDHAMDMKSPDGGSTRKSFSLHSFFITYYPNPEKITQRESKLYVLAHEFAHVFHRHPCAELSTDLQESKKQRDQFELEADRKAIEWGFRPHDDEIELFPTYQRNIRLLDS